MKQTTLLLWLALISGLSVWGQPYESVFGEDSTNFFIVYSLGEYGLSTSYSRILPADTATFDGLIYKEAAYATGQAYLRESEDHSTLWVCIGPCDEDKPEIKIMDLNLAEGDSFPLIQFERSPALRFRDTVLAEVISVQEQGRRKVIELDYDFFFDGRSYKLTFIEGVGPNANFLYPNSSDIGALLCFQKDGDSLFVHPASDSSCTYEVVSIREHHLPVEAVWWHEGTMSFQAAPGDYQVVISDIQGRQVRELDISIASGYTLWQGAVKLNTGIYSIQVRDQGGRLQTFKLKVP